MSCLILTLFTLRNALGYANDGQIQCEHWMRMLTCGYYRFTEPQAITKYARMYRSQYLFLWLFMVFLVLIWRFVNSFRFIESCNWLQYRCAPWRLPKEQSNNELLQTMETASTKGPNILRNQEKDYMYMFYLFCWSSEHRRNNCWIA